MKLRRMQRLCVLQLVEVPIPLRHYLPTEWASLEPSVNTWITQLDGGVRQSHIQDFGKYNSVGMIPERTVTSKAKRTWVERADGTWVEYEDNGSGTVMPIRHSKFKPPGVL